MNDDLEAMDGLCAKIIEQRDRIQALEAALRLAIEELGWGEMEQTRNRLRAALAPEPEK